jgi:transcriptional regulator GlxA family with amidase domain
VGISPGAYVQALRLERARVLLETTDLRLDELARRCGFRSFDALRRAFTQNMHRSPTEYRAQLRATNVIPIAGGRAS